MFSYVYPPHPPPPPIILSLAIAKSAFLRTFLFRQSFLRHFCTLSTFYLHIMSHLFFYFLPSGPSITLRPLQPFSTIKNLVTWLLLCIFHISMIWTYSFHRCILLCYILRWHQFYILCLLGYTDFLNIFKSLMSNTFWISKWFLRSLKRSVFLYFG